MCTCCRVQGADLWVMQQLGGGVWKLHDMHADDFARPQRDAQQDVKLIMFKQDEHGTRAKFSRLRATCDPHGECVCQCCCYATLQVLHAPHERHLPHMHMAWHPTCNYNKNEPDVG